MKFKLYLIFLLSKIYSNIVKIPFKMQYTNINKEICFYDYLINNKPITNISIGTPFQNIPLKIYFQSHPLIISGKNTNGIYNKEISSSYKSIGEDILFGEEYSKCSKSHETILINNKNINNFKFVYPLISEKGKNESYFGLVYNNYDSSDYYFVLQLQEKNIIKSHIYSFDYINENEGYLILGDYFHNFNNFYLKENFIQINNEITFSSFSWNLKFEIIKYDEIKINKNEICSIDPTFNGIILYEDLFNQIKNSYFDYQINIKRCVNKIINNISYFECEQYINIKNFKSLSFYHKDLNYTFFLDYSDLFFRKNNKMFFKIVLNQKNPSQCLLGIPLIQKYKINFDHGRKIMGLYIKINKKFNFWNWIIIFILFIFCLFLIIKIVKIMKSKRKRRMNEIEDIYDYLPEND